MSSIRLGNYELLGLLGKGGMAEVFRARAFQGPWEGQQFALKRLKPQFNTDDEVVGLFMDEGDLSTQLDHPNIVKVHQVGAGQDAWFLVMELIDGRDVGQIIKRCQKRTVPWPIDFAVYLAKVLLDALGYAHRHPGQVVHCDVSPSNFFVSRTGELKLGDFGVARVLLDTAPRETMGKPYYLSPEALQGEISPSVDLWAVTVTLYELLTLQRPFVGANPDEVFAKIRAQQFTPVRELRPEVPEQLERVIQKGFAANPADRFTSAAEYADALIPLFDERIGTPLAISAIVRGLFGAEG